MVAGDDPLANEAELAVVAALMLKPEALLNVGKLDPEDFYNYRYRSMFVAIRNLYDSGVPVDPMTLSAELSKLSVLEACGGLAGVSAVVLNSASADNVAHYAGIVRDRAFSRRLTLAASAASQRLSTGADWRTTLMNLRSALEDLEDDAHTQSPTLKQAMARELDKISDGSGGISGLATGLGIERACPTGIPLGFVTTIFGESGNYKTTLVSNLAWNMAAAGNRVLSISFEDSTNLAAQRALGRSTGVSYGRIAARTLEPAERLVLNLDAADGAVAENITQEDRCEPTIEAVIRLARYYKRTRGVVAVIVDYLQLLDGRGTNKDILDDAIQQAQRAAKADRMAYIFVSQVKSDVTNRKPEDGGPRPTLEDCLGSSAMRIGTKLGIGVFRPWKYCRVPLPKGAFKEYAELALKWPSGKGDFLKDVYPRILEVSIAKNVLGEAPVIIPCLVDLPTGKIEPFEVQHE